MNVTITHNFAGALSFFGVLAYPRAEDADKAEGFKEALFWGQVCGIDGHKPREFSGISGPTGKPLSRLKPREYERTIDRGLKKIYEGHKLMRHLHDDPRAGASSEKLKESLRGGMNIDQWNFYRQMRPFLPAMALHYGLASAHTFRHAPNASDLLNEAMRLEETKVNSLGHVIANQVAAWWEERTGVEQVTVTFVLEGKTINPPKL